MGIISVVVQEGLELGLSSGSLGDPVLQELVGSGPISPIFPSPHPSPPVHRVSTLLCPSPSVKHSSGSLLSSATSATSSSSGAGGL